MAKTSQRGGASKRLLPHDRRCQGHRDQDQERSQAEFKARGEASNARGSTYGAKDITVLEGLEAVRRRPGMYIGSTGPRGLHHLVYEGVDNSVDEAIAGHAKRVTVTLTRTTAARSPTTAAASPSRR